MEKNKIKFLVVLLILTFGVACTKNDKPAKPEEDKIVIERDYFGNYNWFNSQNDGISLLVYGREYLPMPFSVLNNKEMVTDRSRYIMSPGRMPKTVDKGPGTYELSFIDEIEYFSLAFYNPSSKSLEHEIDLSEFLILNSEYKLTTPIPVGYQNNDGKNYISLSMYKLTNEFENEVVILSEIRYRLLIDLENFEMKIVEDTERLDPQYYFNEDRLGLIDGTNIAIQNGIELEYGYNKNVHEIVIELGKLPKNNTKLNTLFSNLEEKVMSPLNNSETEKKSLSFYFFSPENSLEVLSYFVEDDKEIEWDGVELSAGASVDGTDHEIHSVEEFIELYKFIKKGDSY